MKAQDYYVGLDLGTNSVGWAVTDEKYKLQRFNGKDMWGSRLFPKADTASERRSKRSSRRRLQRQKKRICLLQEIFAEEISKVDPNFYLRLEESSFYLEDKNEMLRGEKYNLLSDSKFTDIEYHKTYPTIYHLRQALMDGTNADIRLLYLALHHILKYRGNFLFEGQEFKINDSFDKVYEDLRGYLYDNLEFDLPIERIDDVRRLLLKESVTLRDKLKELMKILDINKDQKQLRAIFNVMLGAKESLGTLFDSDEYKNMAAEIPSAISFKSADFDEKHEDYEMLLNEGIELLDRLKAVYDWVVLSKILKGSKSISQAKIEQYESHKEDLSAAKYFVRKYGTKEQYKQAFSSLEQPDNYVSYVKKSCHSGKKQAANYTDQEKVNNYFEKLLATFSTKISADDLPRYNELKKRLSDDTAFPKLRTSDNGVIPYQIHLEELEKILANAEKYHSFLAEKDENGLSASTKIKKIFLFRIPYFVGPLNTFHSDKGANSWMCRKQDGPITPWNYEEKIDLEKSAEIFIQRMTNRCTYLVGENVIPKQSLLFEEFKVLNELNNLTFAGQKLPPKLKKDIFENVFMTNKKVTLKKVVDYLCEHESLDYRNCNIGGIDGEFKSSLSSYHQFKRILGDDILFEPKRRMIEDIIKWKCIFSEGGKIFSEKLRKVYGDKLTKKQIEDISRLKFSGWSPFSEKFLCELPVVTSQETGECYPSVIDAMKETTYILMELMNSEFGLVSEITNHNRFDQEIKCIDYKTIFEGSYLSPAVKRTVWQTICILEEIRKIRKEVPKKIFIEMTRAEDKKKERKDSRRNDLIELYKTCKNKEFQEKLSTLEDSVLRSKKIYLYFVQNGRCAYSGEIIDFDSLRNNETYYDIDHIYPRSLTKDDSMDNLVLVKAELNREKSDTYPISSDIRSNMSSTWKMWYDKKFISQKKYDRLIRATELSDDELVGFISRQLVETGQATKATADIIRKIYPTTDLVYVKAGLVSDFRHHFDVHKCRSLNDFHHAHDAYLNIITGNVHDVKFTKNPYNFVREKRKKASDKKKSPYSIKPDVVYGFTVNQHGKLIWDKDKMIGFIKRNLERTTVNVTKMSLEYKGQFFDETRSRKTNKDAVFAPIKASDPRYNHYEKYGAYQSVKGSYFFIVEHDDKKGRRTKTFEQVYVLYLNRIKDNASLEKYCKDILGLINPKVIVSKIKLNSIIEVDGYAMELRGRTGNRLQLCPDYQVCLPSDLSEYFRLISKENYVVPKDEKKFNEQKECSFRLFNLYCDMLMNGIHAKRPNNQLERLQSSKGLFEEMDLPERNKALLAIHDLFGRNGLNGVDLEIFGAGKHAGKSRINKAIGKNKVAIINKSITGLYVNQKEIN